MSKRDTFLLPEDMLDSALKIKRYPSNMNFDSFLTDEKTIDAVVRNSEVDWTRIRGFRNRIVHDYFGIDYETVREIVENNFNELTEWLQVMINDKNNPVK